MLRISLDDKNVYVSYAGGPWEVHPISNAWLWTIGALREGEKITVSDTRKNLEPHQYNMSMKLDASTGDMEVTYE